MGVIVELKQLQKHVLVPKRYSNELLLNRTLNKIYAIVISFPSKLSVKI